MKKNIIYKLESLIKEASFKINKKNLMEELWNLSNKIIIDSPIYSPSDDSTDYRLVYLPPHLGDYSKDSTNPLDGVVIVERNFKRRGEWSGTPGRWYLGTLLKSGINDILMIDGGQDWKVKGTKNALKELLDKLGISQEILQNLIASTRG